MAPLSLAEAELIDRWWRAANYLAAGKLYLYDTNFMQIDLTALGGSVPHTKGMALFPRKLAGRYAMLGRQDHENIWLLTSHDLYRRGGGAKIVTPRWPWEYIQMGNCGSPMEIDEGWLSVPMASARCGITASAPACWIKAIHRRCWRV